MSASHSQSSRRRSFSEASRGKSLGGLSYPQGPRPHRPAASIIPRSAPVISITREPSAFLTSHTRPVSICLIPASRLRSSR